MVASAVLSDAAVEALGGSIGSCIAFGLTYPLTTVSTWQALQQKQEEGHEAAASSRWLSFLPSPFKELVEHVNNRGWGPLYAGIRPFLVATAVSNGLYFYLYSAIRQAVVAAKERASKVASPQPQGSGTSSRSTDVGLVGSLVVASVAGCINAAATHPMWLVSVRQQAAQRRPPSIADGGGGGPRSAWSITQQVYAEEGITGLWKGLVPALIMVVNPTIQFILYERLTARLLTSRRRHGGANSKVLSAQDAFLLSALAKLGATLATYPMLLIKSRMQNSGASAAAEERYNGVMDALARIIRTEGPLGLYKGMKAKMVQTVLGAALLMGIKEQVYNTIRTLQAAQRTAPAAVAMAR